MNAFRCGRLCRFAGIAVIVGALALLPWKVLQLHHLRPEPNYFDPTEGERDVLANYLYILEGIAAGCILLWFGGRLEKTNRETSRQQTAKKP